MPGKDVDVEQIETTSMPDGMLCRATAGAGGAAVVVVTDRCSEEYMVLIFLSQMYVNA